MTYPGGKGGDGVYQRIINQMPPHSLYVEPFLGGGAVMRVKRPAAASIGWDRDINVIAQWVGHEVPGLTVDRKDAIKTLEANEVYGPHWDSKALIYCDPPYLISTRRQHRPIYRYELTEADHKRLLQLINSLSCMVMISGYWSDLYARELADWRAISFQAVTRGGRVATEWLWMNFPEPSELHDYRYLGQDFRERERIKRKVNRWKAKLERMPILERRAVAAALAEIGDSGREKEKGSEELAPLKASTRSITHLAEIGDARSARPGGIAKDNEAAASPEAASAPAGPQRRK